VALRLREVYLEAATGRRPEYEHWLTYVNGQ
jgi:branched-chain amino acid aminotransferase